jgi:GT2 family glycosyltransferase
MKIALVCTNFNNSVYSQQLVHSLSTADSQPPHVVIVDNNSDNKNIELLKALAAEFQNLELILNKENVGYFRGLNQGIRRLRSSRPNIDLIVIGNNDLEFPADFQASLKRNTSVFEKYAVVSPDIVTMDGVHQNPHVINRISKFRECIYDLYHTDYRLALVIRQIAKLSRGFTERPDQSQHDIAREIFMGLGACYILSPVFFRHFQELWAPTFLMHEEYFLSKQLSEKGLSIFYEPSIKVLHHFHGALSVIGDRKTWEASRNAHKIYRQHMKTFS